MRKLSLLAILLTGCLMSAYAQNDVTAPDSKQEKGVDQFVGVQLNGLIRQVFNFDNGTSSTIVSPYLLTYNIDSRKTGWGLRVGIGYNYTSTWSNDGITEATTKLNDMQFRLGVEKAFKLPGKWTTGVGVDLLLNTNNDNTNSTVMSFDTVTTVTKTLITSYGGGVMAWLRYNITTRISIGTEASFYYTTGKQKNTTDVTQDSNTGGFPQLTTTETTSNPTITNGTITLPVAFYLAVKF